jgi:hypothetical protein
MPDHSLTPTTNEPYEPDLIPAPWDTRVGGRDEKGRPNWPDVDIDQYDEKILKAFFSRDFGAYAFLFLVLVGGILLLGSLVVALAAGL